MHLLFRFFLYLLNIHIIKIVSSCMNGVHMFEQTWFICKFQTTLRAIFFPNIGSWKSSYELGIMGVILNIYQKIERPYSCCPCFVLILSVWSMSPWDKIFQDNYPQSYFVISILNSQFYKHNVCIKTNCFFDFFLF